MTAAPTISGWCLRPGGRAQAPPPPIRRHVFAWTTHRGPRPTVRPVGAASDELGETRFEELVPRALAGERQAWEALVDGLKRVAWRSIAGFDLGDEDRKDAFAATFFRLNERLSTIREPAKLPGWVATTAPRGLPLVPHPAVSDEGLMDDELHGAVRLGFASISARCQELLRLVTLD